MSRRNPPSGPSTDERPWASSQFWLLQLVVLAVYLIRLVVTVAFHLDETSLAVEISTFALFVIPVTIAALNYGLRGAAVTSGWVTLLAVPRFVFYAQGHDFVAAWAELIQVVVLDALSLLIGTRVSAERQARWLADSEREAHLSAEARYRDLFETNQAPILIVDTNGYVLEANASAKQTFGAPRKPRWPGDRPSLPEVSPVRLVDMIGPVAAGQVLTQLISAQIESADGLDQPGGPDPGLVTPVAFDVAGEPTLYRPTATMIGGTGAGRAMQVVFEDVTAETRRHDRMEAYAARVVLGQEEERRRIAQELHDGPVQSLIHLCRQIDAVGTQTSPTDQVGEDLSELRTIAEDTVTELRSIAKGLRPSILDDLGLVASINQLLTDAGRRQRFETSFGVTGDEHRLSTAVELALFRIAQEALTNIERHADARHVSVAVDFGTDGLRLVVQDDGVGFDAGTTPASRSQSLGLPGMTERAHLIGARLRIMSEPGAGTTVDVLVPATILDQE
ncbi:MAG: histidine kinase [Acidimicrobiales bacterium]